MVFRSIRSRIAVTYVLLIAIVMAAFAWYMLTFVRQGYVSALRERMISQAQLIADVSRPLFLTGGATRAEDIANQYAEVLGARVTFINAVGEVIGDSEADASSMLNHLRRPEIRQAQQSGLGVTQRFSDTLAYNALYVAVPVTTGNTEQGFVRLAVPLKTIDEEVALLRGRILATTGLTLLVAAALGIVIAERTARPIRELSGVVRRMAEGDLSVRIVPRSRDEVGTLTQDFSTMADRLRATILDLSRERSEAGAILEQMADGIIITDATGSVQLINPAAQRLLRTSADEAMGRSLAQVAREEEIILLLRACLRERRDVSSLVEIPRTGQSIHVVVTPIAAGTENACLVMLQDLSHVRRLEGARRDFVSNISHELRTPLASLRALVDTLRDGAMEDPPAAAHFLERMDYEIDDLTQMVEEILQLSRIESGQVPMRLAPVAVAEVIAPAVERLRPQADRAQVALHLELPPDLPQVLADREQLPQVVTNLVQNAIKFTPPGGRVTITAEADEAMVTVTVADTGIGIPAAALPRVFERFFKADQSRASHGTGLGLAIVKHIIQAHDGEVQVSSTEGKGSTFAFTLRRA